MSDFLKARDLSSDITPLIIAGEFNSTPDGSAIHMMTGKKYYLTQYSDRTKEG